MSGTGEGLPKQARAAVRDVAPVAFRFGDDGKAPNNPDLPFVAFHGAIDCAGASDPAAVVEQVFAANGWGQSWRNGVYPFLHYHSAIHEVLGVARGHARVRFGGDAGAALDLAAGDVAVLPAGTGHQKLEASADFLVVGAYPPQGSYDLCRGSPEEHARAVLSIPKVPAPESDPVYGRDGPLLRLWRPVR